MELPAVSVALEGADLLVSFLRKREDLSYIVELSTDLTTWTHVVTDPGVISTSTPATETVSAASERLFLRLRVY